MFLKQTECHGAHSLSGCAEQVEISVVEIYCEVIKDLLSTSPGSASLTVQQDREHGLIIAGAVKVGSFYMVGVFQHLHCKACDRRSPHLGWCGAHCGHASWPMIGMAQDTEREALTGQEPARPMITWGMLQPFALSTASSFQSWGVIV